MQETTGEMERMKDWASYHCPSLKPLQDLSHELTGAIGSHTVSHLTQVRDVA
jgi:hypothetical protein